MTRALLAAALILCACGSQTILIPAGDQAAAPTADSGGTQDYGPIPEGKVQPYDPGSALCVGNNDGRIDVLRGWKQKVHK